CAVRPGHGIGRLFFARGVIRIFVTRVDARRVVRIFVAWFDARRVVRIFVTRVDARGVVRIFVTRVDARGVVRIFVTRVDARGVVRIFVTRVDIWRAGRAVGLDMIIHGDIGRRRILTDGLDDEPNVGVRTCVTGDRIAGREERQRGSGE